MTPLRVGFRCDAGHKAGVGHLVRCVALAEQLLTEGIDVVFLGDLGDLAWARRQLDGRRLPLVDGPTTPAGMVAAAHRLCLDALVLDSYELDPACAGALRRAGVPVLAVVDGDHRGQEADLYLDQNLDAELLPVDLPPGATRLAGVRYALLRDSVRRARPATAPSARQGGPPRVLCFFGGTDAFDAAPVVAELLVATGVPLAVTIVAGRPATRDALAALPPGPGQSVTVIEPTDDLPALVRAADLVVSAAGTSLWELLCLGAPAALLWVVDNQRLGYERVMAHGLAAGLGRLDEVRGGGPARAAAVDELRYLLLDPTRRNAFVGLGWKFIDGQGKRRVTEALLNVIVTMRSSGNLCYFPW
ncbi:UDP-2,4-diacetamido-2,4,6-trideoxy-beta-L-altropyranose hydrolase [Luedemannella flava]|uniref:UDP-2,4-diacetamido-2,4, 6-trideoxy-beta-L-altropyranose hydrolase n=1 Tax=Luedemannella flava TaxID=349316 RepID=A0ABP4YUX4_9ACTN